MRRTVYDDQQRPALSVASRLTTSCDQAQFGGRAFDTIVTHRKSNNEFRLSLTLVLMASTLGAFACLGQHAASGVFATQPEESPNVTKKEIVKTISEEIGMTQLKTKEIVQKTFNAIVETLVEERRIELRNFGVFEVKKRAARKARNPRTGQRVDVPEKFVITFKPGKEMEEKVRELEQRLASQGISLTADSSPPDRRATGRLTTLSTASTSSS